jgi:glycosyltransferase involved in cell wall biosynthesis
VIIPCRNEADRIEFCLSSVLAQEIPDGGFEILVADGISDDGTREIIRRMQDGSQKAVASGQSSVVSGPAIRVIDNPGRIVSTGMNAAIRAARGQIIIRMDAHTKYAPDYICRCLETLNQTGADNVGGPARTRADTSMQKANAAAYHSPFSAGGARFHDISYAGYVDTVTYGCWPRSTFEKFGLFDEELVRNQDDEHNLRIINGGGRIWQNPKIKSWYQPRASLTGLFTQYLQYGYWKVRVMKKHKRLASWRHLVPAAFLLTLALLFLLSAFCFLLSAFSSGQWSVVSGQPRPFSFQLSAFSLSASSAVSHFCFLLSAFCFISLLSAYALAVLAASGLTAAKTQWRLFWILPFVFPCYHFGYGYGFLRGIWDFVIRRKGPRKAFGTLTR